MTKFFGILVLASIAFSIAAKAEVSLIEERVEPISLSNDCKIVRNAEPRGDVSYVDQNGKKIVRPIFSDLCNLTTQQAITKIFAKLSDDLNSPIIGVVGENEDQDRLTFVTFTSLDK